MRITARQLRRIIKEEISRSMMNEAEASPEEVASVEARRKQLSSRFQPIVSAVLATNPKWPGGRWDYSFTVKTDGTVDPDSIKCTFVPGSGSDDPIVAEKMKNVIKSFKFTAPSAPIKSKSFANFKVS